MVLIDITDKYRSDAQSWLGRAAQMPVGSWDRERLMTAAKLNHALAELIDRRCGRHVEPFDSLQSRWGPLSTTDATPASFSGESRASRKDHV